MLAAFPAAPPTISGEPTIGELVRILQHLMACAQSHQSDISRLNLLYVCIPAQLYHHYNETNKPYPTDPVDPGPMPIYTPGDDAAAHCNIRAQWEYAHKQYNDMKTMNTALVDQKLSLIAKPYKAEFNLKRYSNPNMNFKDAFQIFLDNFGATTSTIVRKTRTERKHPGPSRMDGSYFRNESTMASSMPYLHNMQSPTRRRST